MKLTRLLARVLLIFSCALPAAAVPIVVYDTVGPGGIGVYYVSFNQSLAVPFLAPTATGDYAIEANLVLSGTSSVGPTVSLYSSSGGVPGTKIGDFLQIGSVTTGFSTVEFDSVGRLQLDANQEYWIVAEGDPSYVGAGWEIAGRGIGSGTGYEGPELATDDISRSAGWVAVSGLDLQGSIIVGAPELSGPTGASALALAVGGLLLIDSRRKKRLL